MRAVGTERGRIYRGRVEAELPKRIGWFLARPGVAHGLREHFVACQSKLVQQTAGGGVPEQGLPLPNGEHGLVVGAQAAPENGNGFRFGIFSL